MSLETPESYKLVMKKLGFGISFTKKCLEKMEVRDRRGKPLEKFARDYYNDALYYAQQGDTATALESVAYAQGFLDAGVLLGLIKIRGYHLKDETA